MHWEDLRNLYGAKVFISISGAKRATAQIELEERVSELPPIISNEVSSSEKAKIECDSAKITVAESEERHRWPAANSASLVQESEINRRLKSGFKSGVTKGNAPKTDVFYLQGSGASDSSGLTHTQEGVVGLKACKSHGFFNACMQCLASIVPLKRHYITARFLEYNEIETQLNSFVFCNALRDFYKAYWYGQSLTCQG